MIEVIFQSIKKCNQFHTIQLFARINNIIKHIELTYILCIATGRETSRHHLQGVSAKQTDTSQCLHNVGGTILVKHL